MAATFVPFTPHTTAPALESGSSRSNERGEFASFTPPRTVPAVAAPSDATSATAGAPSTATIPTLCHAEPQITLERDQDRITQIRIQCPCGQLIEISCGY